MKFGYAWTFVNKPRGGTPAPPQEKRAPALPRRRLACGIRIGPPHPNLILLVGLLQKSGRIRQLSTEREAALLTAAGECRGGARALVRGRYHPAGLTMGVLFATGIGSGNWHGPR